ncbi:purine-cytosine permease family protein [Subtercola endophyticus]|uniref:purine-cytosine permease family protein n=1 Tax=Subtercola endophyticus TaxID=2895559 RepID=UPI001E34C9D0|nr:cytosine permease [Subtercola endophyticus]UFS57557.1 cytosine permease [Subtercola endophyticus]
MSATPEAAPEIDDAGRIETRGIDYIPPAERHGRPSSLFWVWMSANVTYVYFVLGGVLILLGLPLWQALVLTILGNLWWVVVGWMAISGPASGTPSVMIMRAMFGVRGNKIFGAALGVLIGLFYEILNITFATFSTVALLGTIGIGVDPGVQWIVLIVVTVLSFGISVYGHGTILRLSPIFAGLLAACFVVVGVFVFGAADFGYQAAPLATSDHWGLLLLGFAIVASGPLSWGTSADYSRYLPATVSKRAVVTFTALGGFVPAVVIGALGVLAGTSIDMTDPQVAIADILPAWLYPIFLFVIVLGSITNNVLTSYSTGLYVQALGVRIHRAWSVVLTGVIAAAASAYLVFAAQSFLDTLNSAIELSVAVLGPLLAVYAVDVLLRRNRYDGIALNDDTRQSAFWYRGGFYWPGIISVVVAVGVSLFMVNNSLYVGPIAEALAGADISPIAGPLIAGVLYAVLWRTTAPYNTVGNRPIETEVATGTLDRTLTTIETEVPA